MLYLGIGLLVAGILLPNKKSVLSGNLMLLGVILTVIGFVL